MIDADRVLAATADLETPVAVVDVDAMERNLARMSALAADAGIRLRPHAKTHKMPVVARRQIEHGATGLTVATLREAEVFADAAIDDLLLAHPPVGPAKLRRLAALGKVVRRLAVSLDSLEIAQSLPDTVDVYWEVDTGGHRIGTREGDETASAVAQLIDRIGGARVRGLITHGGHAYAATSQVERHQAAEEESGGLIHSAALLRTRGIAVRELSIGATPTADIVGRFAGGRRSRPRRGEGEPRITEMRPGTYVFGDANQVTLGSQRLDECALAVVATVVSTPAADRAVLDSGSKSLSADLRVPGLLSHGIVLGRSELSIDRLSEEHATVTAPGATGLRTGDRLVIIPAHVCTTVNLHPAILFVAERAATWQPVEARGWR